MLAMRRKQREQRGNQFRDKVREAAQRHQANMIRRAVSMNRNVPLYYYDYSYWWLRRCGFCSPEFKDQFPQIWRWWKGLDMLAQHALMKFNRRFGTKV